MDIIRTLLTALLAISLATLPAVGGLVVVSHAAEVSAPDDMPASSDMPCHSQRACKASAACAAKCFNFAGLTLPALALPAHSRAANFAAAGDDLRGRIDSPPTHPPPHRPSN